MTVTLRGVAEPDEVQQPTANSVRIFFEVPMETEDGDVLVVVASVTGRADDAPQWSVLSYEDTTLVVGGNSRDAYVLTTSTPTWEGLFASDGIHESGHGRLVVEFAPQGVSVDPLTAHAVLLVYGGVEGISATWNYDSYRYDGDTRDIITTYCNETPEQALQWIHVLQALGPGLGDVTVGDAQSLVAFSAPGFGVTAGGVAPSGDAVTWQTTDELFDHYKWIVFGLTPILDVLDATEMDVAGAVGSGRYPV